MSEQSEQPLPYFMKKEIVLRQIQEPRNCWITCLGKVYQVSEYVDLYRQGMISKFLQTFAGKDVSHWFDARSQRCGCSLQLRKYIDLVTGNPQILLPYSFPVPDTAHSKSVPAASGPCECSCKNGIVTVCQAADLNTGRKPPEPKLTGKCWSELEHVFGSRDYLRGYLTKKERPCGITNVLTSQRVVIPVCEEDSLERIRERALMFNRHGGSYTCKFEGKLLDTSLSLSENGIPDERERYLACGLPDDKTTYIPNLLWYFNDDLTEL